MQDLHIVDVFCGIGGFAAGAAAADVGERRLKITGIDHEKTVLGLFGLNVKSHCNACVKTIKAEIGKDTVELPTEDGNVIVHFSPPCTAFSVARRANPPTKAELEESVALVKWCLDTVLNKGYLRWNLENVATDVVKGLLQEYKCAHPLLIDYDVFDASNYGCPSDRKRLIAGPPQLIKRLGEMMCGKIGVNEAFEKAGWEVPALFTSNGNRSGGKHVLRGVVEPTHTITASHNLVFCNNPSTTLRCVKPCEASVLLGFPTSWRLPAGSKAAQRGVGNAFAPPLAKLIVEILVKMEPLEAPPPAPTVDSNLRDEVAALRAIVDEQRADLKELFREMKALKKALKRSRESD